MQIEWYGQSSFRLSDGETTVFIDPFGDMSALVDRGVKWEYPPISGVSAHLLLVTHEHLDHNAVEVIDGEPVLIRSTAGTHESPIGEIVGVASEHDDVAGTQRGANVMYVFSFAGKRIAHLGDLGQRSLRPEQLEALGRVDVVFLPVGGGPTQDAAQARATAEALGASIIVPKHYRTEKIGFLETVDAFLEGARVERVASSSFETEDLPDGDGPLIVVPAAP